MATKKYVSPSKLSVFLGKLKEVFATKDHTHNYAGSTTSGGDANAAKKLSSAKKIGVSGAIEGTATEFDGSKNIYVPVSSVKEAYLSWGGQSLYGCITPIDTAASALHSANRFALANANGIKIEYSTDGKTFSEYNAVSTQKVGLVSGIGTSFVIGSHTSGITINDKLRITLNATDMGVYTRLQKLLINVSTNNASGSFVYVETANKGSEQTFSEFGQFPIAGWSGWNSIPIQCAFGGGSHQTSNKAIIRLTFGITGLSANTSYSSALQVLDIIAIGDTYWQTPSNFAKTGHLYSWDVNGNATFPAGVTAKTINGHTIAADVPSGAKFTDTTYEDMGAGTSSVAGKSGLVPAPAAGKQDAFLRGDGTWAIPQDTTYPAATTSSPGLMSASDKSKLDGIASSATKVSVDSALSSSSTNPVQNKVVNSALASKATRSIYTVTLGTNWTGSGPYTQTVSVSGVLSSDNPHIFPQYSSTSSTAISQKEDWNKIDNAVSNNGSITFTCFENKQSNSLSLIIEVIR